MKLPKPSHRRDSTDRASLVRPVVWTVVAVLALSVLIAGFLLRERLRRGWLWYQWFAPESISLATGPKGSPYYRLGRHLEALIEDRYPELEVGVFETEGNSTNAEVLQSGQADIGFIQNRPLEFPYPSLRTLGRLYEEVLQVVVRPGRGINQVMDLEGRRVHLGPCNSSVRELTQRVLDHYGLEVEGRADCSLEYLLTIKPGSRPQTNRAGVDAIATLGGLPSQELLTELGRPENALAGQGWEFLPLGEVDRHGSSLEGLSYALEGTSPARVPAQTYGMLPVEPVGTLAVETLLASREEVPEWLTNEITRLLFESRFRLSEEYAPMEQMEELPVGARLRFPVHPGAVAFYARNQPHPLVEWAEPLNLALAVLLSLGSGFFALREWFRRTKKNRIDTFYVELEQISDEIAAADSVEEIVELEGHLHRLRKRAFRELVAERLQADESFSIFQTSLSHRLTEISHRLGSGLVEERSGSGTGQPGWP